MSYRRVECVEVILKETWQSCKETPNSLWWQMVGKPELVLKIHFCHKFMSHPSISVWKMTKEKTTRLFPLIQEPNNDYKNRINTQIVGITENRTGYWQRPEDWESSDLEKSLKLAKKKRFPLSYFGIKVENWLSRNRKLFGQYCLKYQFPYFNLLSRLMVEHLFLLYKNVFISNGV